MRKEHLQVLVTLRDNGLISQQNMKSIRGQVLSMKTDKERECYLKKIISRQRRVV